MTVPVTEDHEHACHQPKPHSAVSTSSGFTTEYRAAHIPQMLPSCQQPNFYVQEWQAYKELNSKYHYKVTSVVRLCSCSFPSLAFPEDSLQLFVTSPSLCLQFPVFASSNPSRVKLMDCDKARFQIIALTRVVW